MPSSSHTASAPNQSSHPFCSHPPNPSPKHATGLGLVCLVSKKPGPALCPLPSTVPVDPFPPSGPFGLLSPHPPPTCPTSPSRNELHPKSGHWQSQAQGDGLVAEDREASALRVSPGRHPHLPVTGIQDAVARYIYQFSLQQDAVSPGDVRERRDPLLLSVLREEPQVQRPRPESALGQRAGPTSIC